MVPTHSMDLYRKISFRTTAGLKSLKDRNKEPDVCLEMWLRGTLVSLKAATMTSMNPKQEYLSTPVANKERSHTQDAHPAKVTGMLVKQRSTGKRNRMQDVSARFCVDNCAVCSYIFTCTTAVI